VEDLSPLETVGSLEHLVIGNLPATRLPLFAELRDLKTLTIGYDRFDKNDIAAFKKAHPRCGIVK
jgi:hypothetical protein